MLPELPQGHLSRVYVYVAGPLTSGGGGTAENVRAAIAVADELLRRGLVPYLPHLTHFWHMISPKPGSHANSPWMMLDRAWLEKCDALVLIPGESTGAAMEVSFALSRGIPVYLSTELDLLEAGFAMDIRHTKGGD